jgi:hypothetical protein
MGKSQPSSSTSSSGSTSTTTNLGPWAPQQPYLTYGFQQARNLFDAGGPSYYPGAAVASPSADTLAAQRAIAQRALAGSPVLRSADDYLQNSLNGNYLSAGNPYFQGMVSQLGQSLQPQIASGFEAAGRYGSGSQAAAFADALSKQASQLAYQNYAAERQNQLKSLTQAPVLADQDYTDLGQLSQVGSAQDQYRQSLINADINRYNFNQQAPYNNLANYMRLVQGNYGSSGTQTGTQNSSQTSQTYSSPLDLFSNGLFGAAGKSLGASLGSNLGPALALLF